MDRPLLVVVDRDRSTVDQLSADLLRRYGADFDTATATSFDGASALLARLRDDGRDVALIVAEHWLGECTGAMLLARSKQLFPEAQRALLIDYGDRRCEPVIVEGMGLGYLEHHLTKPWRPREHLLYPVVSEAVEAWARRNTPPFELLRIVGRRLDPVAYELREALELNGIPFGFVDEDTPEGVELLSTVPDRNPDRPVLFLRDGRVLTRYTRADIAEAVGAHTVPQHACYDLVVVGAGPAGMAAAVYGASEGLTTLVVERTAMGGQAGTSSRIRNYLGFPRGVSGHDLATRAFAQAWMLGAEFLFTIGVAALAPDGGSTRVGLSDGTTVRARSVVLATGVTYRRLGLPQLEALVGAGVYYGSAVSEAPVLRGAEVYIVGAGNSAGQAAVYLARFAHRVTLVVRGDTLTSSMSDYLIREIGAVPNITVTPHTEVVDGGGSVRLETLVLRDRRTDQRREVPATALFVMIGAVPDTAWLPEQIRLDDHGFVLTGRSAEEHTGLGAEVLSLQTSVPAVFAAGDVRSGSVKRVAAAVGEGATAISEVHRYVTQASRRT
ncbi:FAD-dependent oxidoreductase [Geodermatophilus sp. SYSU D00710]